MKKTLYILLGAALLAALTSCEPKFEYSKTAYVIFAETSISVPENLSDLNGDDTTDSLLTVAVKAYPLDGKPNTEVEFKVVDGAGDNGAKLGTDFTVTSPLNDILVFEGDSTAYITIHISNANVGIYTGRKQFTIELVPETLTNGYEIGGAYAATVTITDTDKNLDGDTVDGTYNANGDAYAGSSLANQNWDLVIIADDTNPDLVYVDGLTPSFTGFYDTYGTDGVPYGYLDNDETEIHIPTQVLNLKSGGYYLGYMACTEYSDGDFYYSPQYPDIVFYKNSDGTWTSDYGVFVMACSSQDISSASGFYEVVIPSITLTKID